MIRFRCDYSIKATCCPSLMSNITCRKTNIRTFTGLKKTFHLLNIPLIQCLVKMGPLLQKNRKEKEWKKKNFITVTLFNINHIFLLKCLLRKFLWRNFLHRLFQRIFLHSWNFNKTSLHFPPTQQINWSPWWFSVPSLLLFELGFFF